MYDSEGCPIIGFQDRDLREVFGTLNSWNRKQHHRNYLDKIDKKRLHLLIDSVFLNDPLYQQFKELSTPHYSKLMRGRMIMNFVQASLLFFQYPQRQHFSYEGLLAVHILFMRRTIFKRLCDLRGLGYHNEEPIAVVFPKQELFSMAKRLANVIEFEVYKIRPAFMKAVDIDK